MGQYQRGCVSFVQFARWRHWGEVCRLLLHLVEMRAERQTDRHTYRHADTLIPILCTLTGDELKQEHRLQFCYVERPQNIMGSRFHRSYRVGRYNKLSRITFIGPNQPSGAKNDAINAIPRVAQGT